MRDWEEESIPAPDNPEFARTEAFSGTSAKLFAAGWTLSSGAHTDSRATAGKTDSNCNEGVVLVDALVWSIESNGEVSPGLCSGALAPSSNIDPGKKG